MEFILLKSGGVQLTVIIRVVTFNVATIFVGVGIGPILSSS